MQESDIKWASRWDTYLTMSDVQIHWFSIINSVVVVFFLSGEAAGGWAAAGGGWSRRLQLLGGWSRRL